MKPRTLVKAVLLGIVICGVTWAAHASSAGGGIGLGGLLGPRGRIGEAVSNHGFQGAAMLLAVGTFALAIGLPRQSVCFLAGYAFGIGPGLILGSAASLFGCMCAFGVARGLGREIVRRHLPIKLARLDDYLAARPLVSTLIVRLLPVGNNLLTNLVAGTSAVPALPFFVGSVIGYLPQTAIFVLLGSGVEMQPGLRIGLAIALFLASLGLVAVLRRLPAASPIMAKPAVGALTSVTQLHP